MKFSRLLKTILMLDFIKGLLIAIKEIFKQKKTINKVEKNFYVNGEIVSNSNCDTRLSPVETPAVP